MLEFLVLPFAVSMFITFLLGICVLMQTLTVLLCLYRNRFSVITVFENLVEMAILLQILICSLMHGQVLNDYKSGFVIPIGFEYLRMIVFCILVVVVIIICYLKITLWPSGVILASIITLPILDNSLGKLFPWMFVTTLLYFLVRSIRICKSSIRAIRTNISALSITYAINSLQSGILFSEKDGYTLLSNNKMQTLMIALTGKIYRNAITFYDMLVTEKHEARYKKVELDDQIVYLLGDDTAWMFTKTEINLDRKNYVHISAVDVSEQWKLTLQLQVQEQELKEKGIELKKVISNLNFLSKYKEIENAKMRAHDILGQRLTVLLHTMQKSQNLDYELLTSLSKGLLAELKAEQNELDPYEEILSIQHIFAAIGVIIRFDGKLPNNQEQAHLFVDIIRESSTNAVRHGFATRINVKVEQGENTDELTIMNNGQTAATPITNGSGIGMMKKKVCSLGGSLEIVTYPSFTLLVVLPRGDEYD